MKLFGAFFLPELGGLRLEFRDKLCHFLPHIAILAEVFPESEPNTGTQCECRLHDLFGSDTARVGMHDSGSRVDERTFPSATLPCLSTKSHYRPDRAFEPPKILAMAADALQIFVFPLFAEGALSPADDVLDIAVAAVLVHLLGWHWEFLPAFLAELVPGVDLVPFWTLAVINVYRKWKQITVITEQAQEQRPALKSPQNLFISCKSDGGRCLNLGGLPFCRRDCY